MLQQIVVAPLDELVAQEGALLDDQALACSAVAAPIQIRDDLRARLASEVDKLELIPEIAVHYTRVEAVMFARGAARVLVEPLF